MKPAFAHEGLSRRGLVASTAATLMGIGSGRRASGGPPAPSQADPRGVDRLSRMDDLERYVAIDNRCAWPNLTLLDDGAIVATIFGQPSHGLREGSSECWISRDGGRIWTLLSVPAPHEPGTGRLSVAVGQTPSGAIVVLCGGWELSTSSSGMSFPWQALQLRGYGTWQKSRRLERGPGGVQSW